MSMAPTSPFILFEEKLMEVIKKTPKTSPLEIYILKIYQEMKTETDIVQVCTIVGYRQVVKRF
jgi:hypothetical protein